ncbi:unnamed protein product [Moneuplotes crassus]|uniref:Uncharacterized protein n=1 Tax=Euplotes crassus TaxID=5936 RepID=A0AAD1UIR5_EUPCR|nr:unnamed protein product [Moneuplotes crassus]
MKTKKALEECLVWNQGYLLSLCEVVIKTGVLVCESGGIVCCQSIEIWNSYIFNLTSMNILCRRMKDGLSKTMPSDTAYDKTQTCSTNCDCAVPQTLREESKQDSKNDASCEVVFLFGNPQKSSPKIDFKSLYNT